MKVKELRDLLKKYKDDELRSIVVEMYKSIPKKIKESKEIGQIIVNVSTTNKGKREKKVANTVHLESLKREIENFIDDAYNQYYFAPNRIIPKKERSKWRFHVKRFFKELQMVIPAGPEEEKLVVDLMAKLYEVLCYASGYYLFRTEEPFRAIGMAQVEVYDLVVSRNFRIGKNKESIQFAIELIIKNDVDRDTLYSFLLEVLLEHANLPDLKQIAIEESERIKEKVLIGDYSVRGKSINDKRLDYTRQRMIENLVEIVVRCKLELAEYDEAVAYFYKNRKGDPTREITLYVLLRLLFSYELKDQWIKEYEKAVKKRIKPRDVLINTYNYIKKYDKLPEYMSAVSAE